MKDVKLWSRFGKDEDEYSPLGAETFFVKSDLGSITFVRDAQGHVRATLITAGTDKKFTSRRSSEFCNRLIQAAKGSDTILRSIRSR